MRIPIVPPINPLCKKYEWHEPINSNDEGFYRWHVSNGNINPLIPETEVIERRIPLNHKAKPASINGVWYWEWPDEQADQIVHLKGLIEKAFFAGLKDEMTNASYSPYGTRHHGWEQFKLENGLS